MAVGAVVIVCAFVCMYTCVCVCVCVRACVYDAGFKIAVSHFPPIQKHLTLFWLLDHAFIKCPKNTVNALTFLEVFVLYLCAYFSLNSAMSYLHIA